MLSFFNSFTYFQMAIEAGPLLLWQGMDLKDFLDSDLLDTGFSLIRLGFFTSTSKTLMRQRSSTRSLWIQSSPELLEIISTSFTWVGKNNQKADEYFNKSIEADDQYKQGFYDYHIFLKSIGDTQKAKLM